MKVHNQVTKIKLHVNKDSMIIGFHMVISSLFARNEIRKLSVMEVSHHIFFFTYKTGYPYPHDTIFSLMIWIGRGKIQPLNSNMPKVC